MTNQTKTLEEQMKIAREIMERRREVFAALANPDSMSDELKAGVEAARARLDKYRSKRATDRGE
jgi:hypothetical protein